MKSRFVDDNLDYMTITPKADEPAETEEIKPEKVENAQTSTRVLGAPHKPHPTVAPEGIQPVGKGDRAGANEGHKARGAASILGGYPKPCA